MMMMMMIIIILYMYTFMSLYTHFACLRRPRFDPFFMFDKRRQFFIVVRLVTIK